MDTRIKASSGYSVERQEQIRNYYSGSQLTWALNREKQRTRRQNLRYKNRYFNIISRQRYLLKQVKNLESKISTEITDLKN
jgi:hypothetical protein